MPSKAIEVAKMVGKFSTGIYVDMNNISPKTARNTLAMIRKWKTVDAAIIGSVVKNGLDVKVIASGPYVNEFAELKNLGLNIDVIGNLNGQASAIKLLRSAYTKGVSALLFESIHQGYKMGIDNEVLNYISETECTGFKESAKSRIISAAFHAKRRSEEMNEVVELISEKQNPVMSKATAEFFRNLSKNIKWHGKRPDNYVEVFNLLYED